MNLHPYDGSTFRFRHDDAGDQTEGRAILGRLLGTTPPEGTLYDLSFHSGGSGIFDKHHATLPLSADEARAWLLRRDYLPSDVAFADDAIRWLIGIDDDDDDAESVASALPAFLADHRARFQPPLGDLTRVWFAPESGVNSWELAYLEGGALHYIAFDQG